MAESSETTSRVVFKRAGKSVQMYGRRRQEIEKRKSDDGASSSSSDDDKKVNIVNKRSRRDNPMIQSSSKEKNIRKYRNSTSSSDDGEFAERQRALDIDHSYESSKTAGPSGPSDMGATRLNEMETDFAVDAQAQFERVQRTLKSTKELDADDKVYRGLALYGAKEKQDSAAGNASNGYVRKGPIRAPQFMRASVRWDFAPDICKDYKETGFCTFGDSCKFVHDRTDYKHGWQLEQDYADGKMKEEDADKYVVSDEDEDQLPSTCVLCRESFVKPIVTKCKHYFCEKCALDRYRKTQKCYVCEKNTHGVFNPAKEIIAKIKADEAEQCKQNSDDDEDAAELSAAARELRDDTKVELLDDVVAYGGRRRCDYKKSD